jgi:hypothetical protein
MRTLRLLPIDMVVREFFESISDLPSATLEQIYFAIGAELQDREVTAIETEKEAA